MVGELAIDTDMLGVEIGEREAGGVAAMGTDVWVTGGRSLVRMLWVNAAGGPVTDATSTAHVRCPGYQMSGCG